MNTELLSRLSGARVEIHPKPIRKQTLDDHLLSLGYPMESSPRSNKAALRDAQVEYCKLHSVGNTRVERLEARRGTSAYEVVSVSRGTEYNSYSQRFSAKEIAGRVFCMHPSVDAQELQNLYDEMKEMLPVGSVRNTVEGLLESYCSAVKATAGIYWVPEYGLKVWGFLSTELESLGCLESYTITTNLSDPEQLRWISDKIKGEIEDIAKSLQEGLTERQVRDSTLQKRKDEINQHRRRLKMLEQSLGVTLAPCQELLQQADEALVMKDAVSATAFDGMF